MARWTAPDLGAFPFFWTFWSPSRLSGPWAQGKPSAAFSDSLASVVPTLPIGILGFFPVWCLQNLKAVYLAARVDVLRPIFTVLVAKY